MGVKEVWIFNPAKRAVSVLHADGSVTEHMAGALKLAGTPIELDIQQTFAVLDEV